MCQRRRNSGQVLLLSVVMLSVILGLVGAFVGYLGNVRRATGTFSSRATARQAALAGIEKATWCLNQSSGADCGGTYGSTYAGETGVSVGGSGFYTTTITTVGANLKTVTSTGYFPSIAHPTSSVVLKADVGIDLTQASFHYGVQAGNGGFYLGENAHVVGNIYANGNVTGEHGSYVTGTVWVAGGTALSPVEEQTANASNYEFGRVSPTLDIAQSFRLSVGAVINKLSFYLRKVGTPSNVTVRILADNGGVPSKTVIASKTLNASSVTGSFSWIDVSFSTPPALADNVAYWLSIDTSADSSDYWVIGSQPSNDYANGIGMVSSNWNASSPVWSNAGRDYAFKIWTGGVDTKIDDVEVQQDAHAHTISNAVITQDAYYQTIDHSTVHGASHPGSADPGPQDLPISDAQITQWKDGASAGGTVAGNVTLDGASNTIGPKKITGNLTVTNGGHLTLGGTIYIQGNLTLNNNAVVSLASGYGTNSGVIIVDGRVIINNNVTFVGVANVGEYVLVLTTNSSIDPAAPAMSLSNNSVNSIFYASDGMVSISNNATLQEVTAFKLSLDNNASVEYESGLANINFSSGPGGSWVLKTGTTREIH